MKVDERLGRAMRREILQCLRETQQMVGAARLLGLGRKTLYHHVKVFGIDRRDWLGVQPAVEWTCAPAVESLLLKELSRLLTRYSFTDGAAVTPGPCNSLESEGRAPQVPPFGVHSRPPRPQAKRPNARSPARLCSKVMALARSRPQPILNNDATINLFLRLGIDLRRKNVTKRRHGFWRRFEGELEYLLVDARAAFLAKIKLAHPDCGGSTEEAVSLSVAWRLIKRRFARRGITL